jgi:phosphoglycerate dehydrogenase-like enzyme
MAVILVNLPPHAVTGDDLAQIRATMPGYDIRVTQDQDEIASARDDIEILAGWPSPDVLVSAPNLRWFQQWSAGSDWLTRYPLAIERPFVVTNATGVHPIQITEHVFALILAFVRRLPEMIHNQRDHKWQAPPGETLSELYQRNLLIVGLGAIGERIARVGNAMGMCVDGVRRSTVELPTGVDALYTPDRLLEIRVGEDFVVLAAPLTKATFHIIGDKELRAMKPTAFLVNIGRGKLIDEAALIRALQEEWIGGAGLDVFETEPLPSDSPLWSMPNVIITPHYAGASPRYNERAMKIFLDNLQRYRDGVQLRNLVDKRAAY